MEKELLKKIEELNLEIINLKKSKEYKTGKDFIKMKKMIKSLKIKGIFDKFFNRKKISKLNSHEEKENDFKFEEVSIKRPKIVVYTSILGSYDKLNEPLLKFDNIDYIAYLEDSIDHETNWEIRTIPDKLKEMGNNTLINRYIKLHPFELFMNEGYDYAIYVDGNIKIISDLTSMTYSVNNQVGISLHRHQFRECIYNEAIACKILKKGNYKNLMRQLNRYKDGGFPVNYGMVEGAVIVADLNNDKSIKILDEWWNEFKISESLRDQIALPYVLWKNNIPIDKVANLGENEYKNPKIRIENHQI